MIRQHLIAAIVFVSLLNGLFSPGLAWVAAAAPLWLPISVGLPTTLFLSSLVTATTTLLLAGIPAAVFERLRRQDTSTASLAVWLTGVVVLTLPAAVMVARW
jgi:hypothetical protein